MKPNTNVIKTLNVIAAAIIFFIMFRIGTSVSLRTFMDDDLYFVKALENTSLVDFLSVRYMTWSGRAILETILVETINISLFWKLAIPACIILLAHSFYRLFYGQKAFSSLHTLLAVIIILSMPDKSFNEGALWVTGFYNYLLPVSLGFYSFSIFLRENEHGLILKLLSLAFVIIACSNEQVGVTMIAAILVSYVSKKRFSYYNLIFTTSSVLSFVLLMLAPGNSVRFATESKRIPEFIDFNLLDKIGLGLDRLSSATSSNNMILTFLSIAIIVVFFINRKYSITGFIACTVIAIFNFAKHTVLLEHGFMTDGKWAQPYIYITYIACLTFLVSLIYLFILLLNRKGFNASLFLVIFAPATIIMIGFSPTVYASADRVLFLFQCMMASALYGAIMKITNK
ncbi:TPA: hypothetical protein N2R15_000545 [Citrobacter amalonaticus]|nr:hypothetical protein [Citrobacter amalonaticus]